MQEDDPQRKYKKGRNISAGKPMPPKHVAPLAKVLGGRPRLRQTARNKKMPLDRNAITRRVLRHAGGAEGEVSLKKAVDFGNGSI